MALHHRAHVDDMRHAFQSDRRSRQSQDSDAVISTGWESVRSALTQATDYSSSPAKSPLYVTPYSDSPERPEKGQIFFEDRSVHESPQASAVSLPSTVESDDGDDEPSPDYDVTEYEVYHDECGPLHATPADFAALFPSRRRLLVHHDDTTSDGNLNLRVDTEVYCRHRKCDMTLFHLRMHDLRKREFSFRRYCRDSGREVCHTEWKQQKSTAAGRPSLQRSLSNVIHHMRSRSEARTPTIDGLKRHDSGYASLHSVGVDDEERPRSSGHAESPPIVSTDTIRMEFSNYARADVKRTGSKGNKRYELEYWGVSYAWKRVIRKQEHGKIISFHLIKHGGDRVLAYIVPVSLRPESAEEERRRGGWVPPCSMWLADDSLINGQKDVADVIMASGIIALVDNAIRARFTAKTSKHLVIPNFGVEYVGPRRFLHDMFRRDSDSSYSSRPTSAHQRTSSGHSTASRRTLGTTRQSSYEH